MIFKFLLSVLFVMIPYYILMFKYVFLFFLSCVCVVVWYDVCLLLASCVSVSCVLYIDGVFFSLLVMWFDMFDVSCRCLLLFI